MTADKLRVAKEALEPFAKAAAMPVTKDGEPFAPADGDVLAAGPILWGHVRAARQALAAMNEHPQ